MSRQYEPIWNTLKTSLSVTLKARPINHARIVQAVRKERAIDIAWRTEQELSGKDWLLTPTSDSVHNTLTLTLELIPNRYKRYDL